MRPARLRPRARQPLAAEGLRSHHRADHRAVDVEIADMRVRLGHLGGARDAAVEPHRQPEAFFIDAPDRLDQLARRPGGVMEDRAEPFLFQRSEEHTSELQSLMRISYAVFCLKKKKKLTRERDHTTVIHIS